MSSTPFLPKAGAAPAVVGATFVVVAEDEPGVLHRLVGLFAARALNIESLTVSEADPDTGASQITVAARGAPTSLWQVKAQLEAMVQTRQVFAHDGDPEIVERELALFKLADAHDKGSAAFRAAERCHARVLDFDAGAILFELSGSAAELDAFAARLRPLGVLEVARSGPVSLPRGPMRT